MMQRLVTWAGLVVAMAMAVALAACADAPVDGSGAGAVSGSAVSSAASSPVDAPSSVPPVDAPASVSPSSDVIPSDSASTPQPADPTQAASGEERALPVYYVAETAVGPRLQREFRRLPAADPASAAVTAMLAAPTGADPDYHNPWPAGTTLHSPVSVEPDQITVDLSAASPSDVATQQLVFTVQGALRQTLPVNLLHDGTSTGPAIRRGDAYAVRSLVQIDNPVEGARTGSPLTVTGEAAVFEATLHWTVEREGAAVGSGVATTERGQAFSPFQFSVPLPPGRYVVRISEDDPSGGAGRPVLTDDKTITVGTP